jgi:hypothetical protein
MIIAERRLRSFIRKMLHEEKRPQETIANVSDLQRVRSTFDDWADILLDDLSDKLPKGEKIKELSDGIRKRMIDRISEIVRLYLIEALGYPMDTYSKFRIDREQEKKVVDKYNKRMQQGY